jgi:glycosyltransferase involved in cell wall biosynthesis
MNNNEIFKYTVTAIVSTYNPLKYIHEALINLENQTLYKKNKLEIIIININSDHSDFLIPEKLLKNKNHIRYIRIKTKEKIYEAWNRGCCLAQGEFITNVNIDYTYRVDALDILSKALKNHTNSDIVYANSLVAENSNQNFKQYSIFGCFMWPQYDRTELFRACFINLQPMWRKSLHKQYGFYDQNLESAGDYEFWLRLAASGVHFQHIPECLGIYHMSQEGIEHGISTLSIQESEIARSRYWKKEWGNRPTSSGTYFVPMQLFRSKLQTDRAGKPLVSVIIPTKDRPAMLCDAVKSVLAQTYSPIEVVVINDAGCDVRNDLATIPDSSKITYINLLQNSERSKCRNCGIMLARGDYITYLDDDDIFYPNHIETLIVALTSNAYHVAYSDSIMAQQSILENNYTTTKKISFYSHDFNYEKLLVDNYIPILCVMHKKSCIEKSGYFDNKISTHEDWDLWIRIAQHYDFLHIKKITSEYRIRNDNTNTTNSKLPRFLETYKYIYKKHPLNHSANEFTHLDRKRAEFAINIRAYTFICDLIKCIHTSALGEQLASYKNLLDKCGASQKQIISATLYTESQPERNIKRQRILLLKSIQTDNENYLAWLSLCNNYLINEEFEHVEKILQILIDVNPLELTLHESLISILNFLHKTKKAKDTLSRKEHISSLKNNSITINTKTN